MGNASSKTFTGVGTFIPPAGVTQVTVVTQVAPNSIFQTGNGATTYILDTLGRVFATGTNTHGELGANLNPGVTSQVSSPVQVVGGLTFVKIYCSPGTANQVCFGITDSGQMYAWGRNDFGELGANLSPNTILAVSSPVLVVGGITWSHVIVDDDFSAISVYGIAASGKMYAWGDNTSGRLGIGTNIIAASSPVAVVGGQIFSKIISDNNDDFYVALNDSGAAYAWGVNSVGFLGDNTIVSKSSPVQVVGGITFTQLTAFESGTVGLDTSGKAWGWGQNQAGMLGDGTRTNRSSPVQVVGGITFKKIVGGSSMYGLGIDGTLYAWGANASGQLGLGDRLDRSSPVAVVGGLKFTDVSTLTTTSAFALTATGQMYAWGDNSSGKLGIGNIAAQSSPVQVVGGLTWAALPTFNNSASIASSVLAPSTNGNLYGWGANAQGQLGQGNITAKSSPVQVLGGFNAAYSPVTFTTVIPVVPNTSYSIKIQPIPSFGGVQLGTGIPTSITVYFEE